MLASLTEDLRSEGLTAYISQRNNSSKKENNNRGRYKRPLFCLQKIGECFAEILFTDSYILLIDSTKGATAMVITNSFTQLTGFQLGYMMAALWSSTGDDGEPLDKNFGIFDIGQDTVDEMIADCNKFTGDNAKDLEDEHMGLAGHDFWLTRNSHGAGFWDGGWEENKGKRLTIAAKSFPDIHLYVGDDKKIHA